MTAITRKPGGDSCLAEALRTYVKLLRAGKAVVARVKSRLSAEGLTFTQFGVLEAILHKGPLTQRELGRKVLTSAGNLTDVIDELEARGLVRRVRLAADRRSVQVELTQSGTALIERMFPHHARDIVAAMAARAGPNWRNWKCCSASSACQPRGRRSLCPQ